MLDRRRRQRPRPGQVLLGSLGKARGVIGLSGLDARSNAGHDEGDDAGMLAPRDGEVQAALAEADGVVESVGHDGKLGEAPQGRELEIGDAAATAELQGDLKMLARLLQVASAQGHVTDGPVAHPRTLRAALIGARLPADAQSVLPAGLRPGDERVRRAHDMGAMGLLDGIRVAQAFVDRSVGASVVHQPRRHDGCVAVGRHTGILKASAASLKGRRAIRSSP